MSGKLKAIILSTVMLAVLAILSYPYLFKLAQSNPTDLAKQRVQDRSLPNNSQLNVKAPKQGNNQDKEKAHVTPQPKVAYAQAKAAGRAIYLEFYGNF